jgi:Uma2 family endonuclease
MSTHATDSLEVIEHLPAGATLRLERVGWDECGRLLEESAERPGLRVSYDSGRVEIMSPTYGHEMYKGFMTCPAHVRSEELRIPVETAGATTYKEKQLTKGSEQGESFYVQNAQAIIGRRRIDLSVDPPPDVVVEIDITNESLGKSPIYAAFGVPEIWRYDGERAQIDHLADQSYIEAATSLAFPRLTAQALTDFAGQSKAEGQPAALAAFRRWVRARIQA